MATALFRTIILYLALVAGLRLTGKRQIGELEPMELVLTMLLSDLAAVPMQDFAIPLVQGLVPMVTLLALSVLLSAVSLRSLRFRSLVCGKPAVIIRKGVIDQGAMHRSRLTLDELLEELRLQGVADLETVAYAILETGGQLSVLLQSEHQPLTAAGVEEVALPVVIVNDGRLLAGNLRELGLDEVWLMGQMQKVGAEKVEEIFLLTADGQGKVVCVRKEAGT